MKFSTIAISVAAFFTVHAVAMPNNLLGSGVIERRQDTNGGNCQQKDGELRVFLKHLTVRCFDNL